MRPSKAEQLDLQDSLQMIEKQGRLCVLAAVSGIREDRLSAIAAGADVTPYEYMVLDMLKGV